MKKWELVESASLPGSPCKLSLMRRDDELVIRVDNRELMGTCAHGSEDALADLACDRLAQRPVGVNDARILIGGLGVGFTLAAALRRVGPKGQVVVAELVPAVVEWNRGVLGDAAGRPLEDPRASVFDGSVVKQISNKTAEWDAILCDVDNGPGSVIRAANGWLYSPAGLEASYKALKPGGILGIWSASTDNFFIRRFQQAGFDVEQIRVRSKGKLGGRVHVVWIGVRKPELPARKPQATAHKHQAPARKPSRKKRPPRRK